ncbi:hypothetical protein CEP54_016080 [Fusarium duplospermum]|uniref:Uncharacterized protein n=1 Tax=Fusarium duplospermum TaxID=1325734 RepID=A0A428NIH3_9HYPO|nr:hypothetical protein CEP54_016080 [Fusarium duplospermum]
MFLAPMTATSCNVAVAVVIATAIIQNGGIWPTNTVYNRNTWYIYHHDILTSSPSYHTTTMCGKETSLDALLVGAGFGGDYQLKRLRNKGYNARLVGVASGYGVVWY